MRMIKVQPVNFGDNEVWFNPAHVTLIEPCVRAGCTDIWLGEKCLQGIAGKPAEWIKCIEEVSREDQLRIVHQAADPAPLSITIKPDQVIPPAPIVSGTGKKGKR